MNQDEKMVLLIVQESLIEGDASPARQKELAEMLERVISGGLTKRAADECLCSSDKKHDFRFYTMGHVELCEWCGTRR